MIADGMSASQASAQLGCSRNAALGKASRLGLSFRHSKGRGKTRRPGAEVKQVQAKKTAWTEERIARGAALWKDGLLAKEIASDLGCTTGAFLFITGKHRELFPARGAHQKIKTQDRVDPPAKAFAFDSIPFHLPEFPGVRFVDLKPKDCRWLVSNDIGADMLCCGANATQGSYCGVHAAVSRGRGTESERRAVSIGRAQS
jgi:hypothetical protein